MATVNRGIGVVFRVRSHMEDTCPRFSGTGNVLVNRRETPFTSLLHSDDPLPMYPLFDSFKGDAIFDTNGNVFRSNSGTLK